MTVLAVPFVRKLYPPSSPDKSEAGLDVLAVKRAVSRAGFWPWQEFDQAYNDPFARAVAKLRKAHGLSASLVYDKPTHDALRAAKAVKPHAGEAAFDATALELMRRAAKLQTPSEQQKATELYHYCELFTGPYVWGGEHDGNVLDDNVHSGFDCSSSCSAALAHFGLLGSTVAHVSGWFESWGDSGAGRYFTVHAAGDHVWIEFTIPGLPWARFDTSPHGDGEHGPRMRHRARDESRFVHRHLPGY